MRRRLIIALCISFAGVACTAPKPTLPPDTAVRPEQPPSPIDAYGKNVRMTFHDAEADYRSRVDRDIGSDARGSTVAGAELDLYLALNKSNIGETGIAQGLFEKTLQNMEQIGTTSDVVRARVMFAQHFLNDSREPQASAFAAEAIEQGLKALKGNGDASPTPGDIPVLRARISDQTAGELLLGGQDPDATQALPGQLSPQDQLRVLLSQAYYIAAVAARRSAAEKLNLLDSAEAMLNGIPEDTETWLRTEIARSRALIENSEAEFESAEADASAAVALSRLFASKERPEVLSLLTRGRVLVDAGKPERARRSYRDALEISAVGGSGIRYEDLAPYLDLLLADPAGTTRDEDMFFAIQQIRNPVTTDTLARLITRISAGSSEASLAIRNLQDAERRENRLAAKIDLLRTSRPRDTNALTVARALLGRTRADKAAYADEVTRLAPNFNQLLDPTISLADFRATLSPDEVYVQVRTGDERGVLVAITTEAVQIYELPFGNFQLVGLSNDLRGSLKEAVAGDLSAFTTAAARQLYDMVFGPIHDLVQSKRSIVFAPDKQLLALPPGLFIQPGADDAVAAKDYKRIPWLGTAKAVSIALSPSSFAALRRAPDSRANVPFAAFGDFEPAGPAAVDRIAAARGAPIECRPDLLQLAQEIRLPATRREVQTLSRIMMGHEGAVALGTEFTDTALRSLDLSRTRILHFATHGRLSGRRSCLAEPALVTSLGAGGSDGLLEASEIVDLVLDANMVVLSACDTSGQGAISQQGTGLRPRLQLQGGEALSGLVRAFLYAGARSVVSSHWLVPDEQTADLMEAFYRGIADGKGKAEALRLAQAALVADPASAHPLNWAAFTVVGDARADTALGALTMNTERR